MRRLWFCAVLLLVLCAAAVPAAQAAGPGFTVTQAPPMQATVGDTFTLKVHAPQVPGRWLVSLELMDPVTHDRADFGGWVRSRRWQVLEPSAGAADVSWQLQAAASGRFRLFVHATPADDVAAEGWTS